MVIPQFLGRTEFIGSLDELAQGVPAQFVELLILDDRQAVEERFLKRRRDLPAGGGASHPEADLDTVAVASAIEGAFQRLQDVAETRPRTQVISLTDASDSGYQALLAALS